MYVECGEAERLLENAYIYNPGSWREHSKNVAYAARTISDRIDGMDPSKAYSLGLLHDIGRIRGIKQMKHVFDGYSYLSELGYDENAKICLTHSFPLRNVKSYSGSNDCTLEETSFITDYLNNCEYDEYDKLIQLCDAIALPDTICILEKRLLDVAIRNGINEYSVEKWKAFLNLKTYFDDQLGLDLYGLFGIQI
jgi:hypothetical protein